MPREVMTLRLDRAFRSRLQVAARRRRMTPSAAARVALEDWLVTEDRTASHRPYDEIVDLIGSVRGGDQGRSARGRKWIARQLKDRAARRRQ